MRRLLEGTGSLFGISCLFPGLFLLIATSAWGQGCPDPTDPCGCLGHAADFAIVADKLSAGTGKGGGYRQGTEVDNAVCAGAGSFRETRVASSVLLLAGSGSAGVCKQTRSCYRSSGEVYCETSNGLFVGGDLATGGGTVSGAVDVVGEKVFDGSHERLADCGSAKGDLEAAAAALAALPSNENLGSVVVVAPKPGNGSSGYRVSRGYGGGYGEEATRILSAGPGVHVFRASSVKLKSRKKRNCYTSSGSRYCETIVSAAVLEIALAPETTAVVLNVDGKLLLSSYSQLRVTGGSAPVLIHLVGAKGKAKLGAAAVVGPAILAGGQIAGGAGAQLSNLLAPKVTLKGVQVTDTLLCGPPPPPPPPNVCCNHPEFGCANVPELDCVGVGGTPGPEGAICLGSGECGEPPAPVCCSSPLGQQGTCASLAGEALALGFGSCDAFGMTEGPPGSVCDAATGGCVPAEQQSAGACCDLSPLFGPSACFGGVDAQMVCEDFGLSFEPTARCDTTGSLSCQAP